MQTHSYLYTHSCSSWCTNTSVLSFIYILYKGERCSTHCNNFPQLSDPNLSDTIIRFSSSIAQHERVNGEEGDVDEQFQTGCPLLQLYAPRNMLLYTDKTQQTASLPTPLWETTGKRFSPLKWLGTCVCGALSASTVHQCLPPDRQATDTAPRGLETFSITPSLFPLCQVAERGDWSVVSPRR